MVGTMSKRGAGTLYRDIEFKNNRPSQQQTIPMGGDDDSKFSWRARQDLRVSETRPICRAWPTRGACIRREVAERRQGSVRRQLVSRSSHPGRAGSQGLALALTAPEVARPPGRCARSLLLKRPPIRVELDIFRSNGISCPGRSAARSAFARSGALQTRDRSRRWSLERSRFCTAALRAALQTRDTWVELTGTCSSTTPEPHAPKIDQPILLLRASSATRPRWELPFASRPGDQAAMEALPGAIARMPPPTPLLPGSPTR
jgi:hypothetical protein